jgi:hypothetical protein
MRYFIFFIAFILFLLATPVFAQQEKIAITGTVVNKTTLQPIEFVTVSLLNKNDRSIISGTVTDRKGKFVIENILPGDYLLRCSYIGYTAPAILAIHVTGQQKIMALGTIAMYNDDKAMNEVVVTSSKAMLNASIDRKSYDVTKDIMAQSGTASDVLRNIPSVEVDLDGNISLRGAGDVIILINGRPSPLFGKMNKAEVLQQFPANTIERIEVITNPSARYKPDGTSGIINIVLKKNIKRGWNGSVTANVAKRNRYNASTTLNYNPGKFNIFGTFGMRKDNRNRTNTVSRQYLDSLTGNTSGYYTEDGISFQKYLLIKTTATAVTSTGCVTTRKMKRKKMLQLFMNINLQVKITRCL